MNMGINGEQDLNAKTAYIHLLADAGVSVGVIIAGLFNPSYWLARH